MAIRPVRLKNAGEESDGDMCNIGEPQIMLGGLQSLTGQIRFEKDGDILCQLAWDEEVEKLEQLLMAGLDPNATNIANFTPLHCACEFGRLRSVVLLLKYGAKTEEVNLIDGFTGLHWAAMNGHVQVVKALLKAGANPNFRSRNGLLPGEKFNDDVDVKSIKKVRLMLQAARRMAKLAFGDNDPRHAGFDYESSVNSFAALAGPHMHIHTDLFQPPTIARDDLCCVPTIQFSENIPFLEEVLVPTEHMPKAKSETKDDWTLQFQDLHANIYRPEHVTPTSRAVHPSKTLATGGADLDRTAEAQDKHADAYKAKPYGQSKGMPGSIHRSRPSDWVYQDLNSNPEWKQQLQLWLTSLNLEKKCPASRASFPAPKSANLIAASCHTPRSPNVKAKEKKLFATAKSPPQKCRKKHRSDFNFGNLRSNAEWKESQPQVLVTGINAKGMRQSSYARSRPPPKKFLPIIENIPLRPSRATSPSLFFPATVKKHNTSPTEKAHNRESIHIADSSASESRGIGMAQLKGALSDIFTSLQFLPAQNQSWNNFRAQLFEEKEDSAKLKPPMHEEKPLPVNTTNSETALAFPFHLLPPQHPQPKKFQITEVRFSDDLEDAAQIVIQVKEETSPDPSLQKTKMRKQRTALLLKRAAMLEDSREHASSPMKLREVQNTAL